MYPKNNVYLFSVHDDDKSLSCKSILKIPLNKEFSEAQLELSDFRNSLCLFDDIDVMKKSKLKEKVTNILHRLLETGRHENVSVIYISHLANKGHETRMILNEAHAIVIFPKVMNPRSCKYLLENYFGMTKAQISRVKNLNSRAVTLVKLYPNLVLSEKEVFILDNY
jgi:hypothetical protein